LAWVLCEAAITSRPCRSFPHIQPYNEWNQVVKKQQPDTGSSDLVCEAENQVIVDWEQLNILLLFGIETWICHAKRREKTRKRREEKKRKRMEKRSYKICLMPSV